MIHISSVGGLWLELVGSSLFQMGRSNLSFAPKDIDHGDKIGVRAVSSRP